ncbi:flagellar assembly protein FliX [Methylobacterium sp. ID0610]|uniref:flagellar assembly protein FliX n=1 Tax=Methylobacterium carpenticola TaxID=3344827 RepID=UPI0036A03910
MRVDPRFATAGPGAVTKRPGDASQTFTLSSSTPQAATSAGGAVPLAGLDAILTLQAQAEDPAERRRKSARRGHDLLDALDRLKAALLGGRVNTADLRTIAARLAERMGPTGDPRLDDLIGQIELRAEVELAKLGVAG